MMEGLCVRRARVETRSQTVIVLYYVGVCASTRMYIKIVSSILGEYHRDLTINVMSASSGGRAAKAPRFQYRAVASRPKL